MTCILLYLDGVSFHCSYLRSTMSIRYRYIRDLRPDITDKWTINAMVSRAWTTSNPKTARMFSLDFVLVDEQVS